MNRNDRLTDYTSMESQPESPKVLREYNHCPARQEKAVWGRTDGGKNYRAQSYRGKNFPGNRPAQRGELTQIQSHIRRRVGVMRGTCPGFSGEFDRIINRCGALDSEIFE